MTFVRPTLRQIGHHVQESRPLQRPLEAQESAFPGAFKVRLISVQILRRAFSNLFQHVVWPCLLRMACSVTPVSLIGTQFGFKVAIWSVEFVFCYAWVVFYILKTFQYYYPGKEHIQLISGQKRDILSNHWYDYGNATNVGNVDCYC